MGKKILVAGGAGFIGTNLCKRLLSAGNVVYCLDNLSTGKKSNIEQFKDSNFHFIYHDIIDPINIVVDEIYNLASPASPTHYQKNPVHTLKTNILGSINLLDVALKNNAKIFQASTSEVYGDPLVTPQSETYYGNVNPIGIRACYDESKRVCETLFFDYHRMYGVDIRVIRIFNTYGEYLHKDDGRVISNFINQALNNQPITIYGNGSQTRSFQYISDLLDGIDHVMNGTYIGPINIGNPDEYTMIELAELIINLTNSNSTIEYKELPQDDPKQRNPDISLARSLYNWEPKINLLTGLNKTIEYFKSQRP